MRFFLKSRSHSVQNNSQRAALPHQDALRSASSSSSATPEHPEGANASPSTTTHFPDHTVVAAAADACGRELTEDQLREDAVTEGNCAADVLRGSAMQSGGYFTVPRFGGKR